MRFVYYLQKGIKADVLPEGYDKFYVAEDIDAISASSRYFYPGDDIQNVIDNLCVELYDVFRDAIFLTPEDYYKNSEIQPQWITRAGLDSDFGMEKNDLADCFTTPIHDRMEKIGIKSKELLEVYAEINEKKFKYAYTADCQSLVNTLQELILGCHSSFVGFYKYLSSLHDVPQMDSVYYECSAESRMVYSFLYSFIVQTYSVFDILTKIAYELEHIQSCELNYVKLAADKILFGGKKKLSIDVTGTVFEKCRTISMLENLRNEIVHNATWEMNPKIYIICEDMTIVERHILLPDFTAEGTLVTYKNRKRFFAEGKKVNDELPNLYFDMLGRVRVTLSRLIENGK